MSASAPEMMPAGQFTGHTPGPWHWDADPVKGDPTGRIRYRVCALGKTITQIYYSSFEGRSTNAEADARLIAFAPDLLAERNTLKAQKLELIEALTLLDQAENGPWDGEEQKRHLRTAWSVARTTLAKLG